MRVEGRFHSEHPRRWAIWVAKRWGFFENPDADLRRLLENESNRWTVDYMARDQEITDCMVRKALFSARWRYRLCLGHLLAGAVKRRVGRYAMRLQARVTVLTARLRTVAEREEVAQRAKLVELQVSQATSAAQAKETVDKVPA